MLRTGWTEVDLAAASTPLVAALRHALYAERYAEVIRKDVDDELRDLDEAMVSDPKTKERLVRKRVGERVEYLVGFRKVQSALRSLLGLDAEDAVPDGEP